MVFGWGIANAQVLGSIPALHIFRPVRELAQHIDLESMVCGFDSHPADCLTSMGHTIAALTFVSRLRLENVAL